MVMEVIALLRVVTTVKELVGGGAPMLVVIWGVTLLLTGPLMAAVTVVTAGRP